MIKKKQIDILKYFDSEKGVENEKFIKFLDQLRVEYT